VDYKYIIVETLVGNRLAIVNDIEDGRGLDVSYLIEYDRIGELHNLVETEGGRVTNAVVAKLVVAGLLITPPTLIS
jgi:hypothetical protein